jgi:TrmH family RNA methyltransferase
MAAMGWALVTICVIASVATRGRHVGVLWSASLDSYDVCRPASIYNDSLPLGSELDWLEVVLVSPRNPLNIGAAARAMANFGFARLTVVAPYEKHWREARSAVGAEKLLKTARVCGSLAEAVADSTLVVGTATLTRRKPELPVISLPELPAHTQLAVNEGSRVALVFGPEKRGLTREDLSWCHLLAVIPTAANQPSMNLGQAVAVCLYELAEAVSPPVPLSKAKKKPESGDLDLLAGVIDEVMLAAEYSPESMYEANRHDLRLLLRRLGLTEADVRRALGFFRRVQRRLTKRDKN